MMAKGEPEVFFEAVEPKPIMFRYGSETAKLEGFWAWLYNGMIFMYGELEAKHRMYWYLKNAPKKNSVSTPENAVTPERA